MSKRIVSLAGVVAFALAIVASGVDAGVHVLAPPAGVSCANASRFPRDEYPVGSPDGAKVAFFRTYDWGTPKETSSVVVVDVAGRAERVLGRGESAVWSPDGKELAIARKSSAGFELVAVSADGSAQRTLASGPGDMRVVSWSPDGRRVLLLYSSERFHAGTLVTVPLEGGTPTVLFRQSPVFDAAWSPDGTAIAVLDDGWQVHVFRANGRLLWSIPLVGEFARAHGGLAWSPEGKRLAFTAELEPNVGSSLFVAGLDDRTVRELRGTTEAYGPAWSPDGRWIGYSVEGKALGLLGLVRPDGTGGHFVPASGRRDGSTPVYGWLRGSLAWAGTSTLVFEAFRQESAYNRNFELHLTRVDGRNERRLTYHCQFGSRRSDAALRGTYLADVLRARDGDDRVDAGPGRDVVDAGPGADVLLLKDGERDIADCGTGSDTVLADARDSLHGCERVSRRR